ncbi:MAG: hypothetical protein U0Q16_17235 [Bryobacteraceae bacterium]
MEVAEMAAPVVKRPATGSHKWLAFGSGIGIEIAAADLRITAVRVRPSGVTVVANTEIRNWTSRPATEWGAEYAAFARKAGMHRVPAVVVLPRRDITIRQLSLPGVEDADLTAAIGYQIDSMHPYAQDDVAWTAGRLPGTAHVLVGVARRETIDYFANLFSEAGVRLAGFTFSSSALYSASRILVSPPEGVLAFHHDGDAVEAYGESPAKPIFSGLFDQLTDRVRHLALSELRIEADLPAVTFADLLPTVTAPESFPRTDAALSLAAAMTSACPRLSLSANLLPEERRTQSSALFYLPTAILGLLLVGAALALSYQQTYHDKEYMSLLNQEIAKLERQAAKAGELDRIAQTAQSRMALLDRHRSRSKADADALREATTLVAPPAWLGSMQINRNEAYLNGESDSAAGLLKALDSSPLFKDSTFSQPMTRVPGGAEQFTIRTQREGPGTGPEAEAK